MDAGGVNPLSHLLDEDLAQPALPKGVVLEVEAVEALEDVLVGVDVQHVHIEVVGREVERLKHLAQGQVLAVPVGGCSSEGGGASQAGRRCSAIGVGRVHGMIVENHVNGGSLQRPA